MQVPVSSVATGATTPVGTGLLALEGLTRPASYFRDPSLTSFHALPAGPCCIAGVLFAGMVTQGRSRRCGHMRRRVALGREEIRAAMQLDPARLGISSGDEASPDTQANNSLQGSWLSLFRGSAPYVAMFRQTVMVFHIPGHIMHPSCCEKLAGLMGDIAICALLGIRPVLVLSLEHQVLARVLTETRSDNVKAPIEVADFATPLEAICEFAGKSETNAVKVRRLLKQEAGLVCAEMEGLFRRLAARPGMGDANAIPSFSVFASSQLVSCAPRRDHACGDSQLLARVQAVDVTQINRRLAGQEVVCIIPVGTGMREIRYVPSEELAAEAAKALNASKLVFFTRGQKIVDKVRGNAVSTLQLQDAAALVQHLARHPSELAGEHRREIYCYLNLLLGALRKGTRRGHLIDPTPGALLQELYTVDGSGTMVSCDLYDGIRLADSGDAPGILQLIEPLVKRGLLRQRSNYEVECACNNGEMFVWKRDDATIGCASLQCFEDDPDMAELGCFVVSPKCRGKGHGAVLLSYVEQVALLAGLRSLFLLTTQTMQWFVEHGFKAATVKALPASKQHGYDLGRSSKVYVKDISALPSEVQQRFTFAEVDTLD